MKHCRYLVQCTRYLQCFILLHYYIIVCAHYTDGNDLFKIDVVSCVISLHFFFNPAIHLIYHNTSNVILPTKKMWNCHKHNHTFLKQNEANLHFWQPSILLQRFGLVWLHYWPQWRYHIILFLAIRAIITT